MFRNVCTVDNPLATYIEEHGGTPAKERLRLAADIRWQTLHEIATGRVVPRSDTMIKIERATGGDVSAAALMKWFVGNPPPPRPARVATKRKRRKGERGRSHAAGAR